jgi:DNA-binding MurR/RpiR family transcriptional regulator
MIQGSVTVYKGRIISEIDALTGSYTKSEEIIIDFVKKYFNDVIHLSVTEFSDKIEVGETTIVRLCKKLGYKGYHDFKLAIAQDDTFRKEEKSNSDTISDRIYKNMIAVLEDSKNLIDQNLIKSSIKMMDQAKNIYFYGVGASGITALEAHSKFFRISPKFTTLTDSHFQTMAAQIMTKDDLVIVITISGSTKDIVDAVKESKERGAKVIAITNFKKSPITKYSDVVLLTSGKLEDFNGGSLVEKISQLYVIDILFMEYIQQHKQFEANRELTAMSVASKKY